MDEVNDRVLDGLGVNEEDSDADSLEDKELVPEEELLVDVELVLECEEETELEPVIDKEAVSLGEDDNDWDAV